MGTKVNSNAKPQTVPASLRGDVSYGSVSAGYHSEFMSS